MREKKDINSRADIKQLVDAFYKQVTIDPIIGHYFTDIIKLSWEVHLPIMYDFWESVLLDGSSYKGNAMLKHIDLNKKSKLETIHFERWSHLWKTTINDNFEGPVAEMAFIKARQIATLMHHKIDRSMNKGYFL